MTFSSTAAKTPSPSSTPPTPRRFPWRFTNLSLTSLQRVDLCQHTFSATQASHTKSGTPQKKTNPPPNNHTRLWLPWSLSWQGEAPRMICSHGSNVHPIKALPLAPDVFASWCFTSYQVTEHCNPIHCRGRNSKAVQRNVVGGAFEDLLSLEHVEQICPCICLCTCKRICIRIHICPYCTLYMYITS